MQVAKSRLESKTYIKETLGAIALCLVSHLGPVFFPEYTAMANSLIAIALGGLGMKIRDYTSTPIAGTAYDPKLTGRGQSNSPWMISVLTALVVLSLAGIGGCASVDLAKTASKAEDPLDKVELLAGAAVETYKEVASSTARLMLDPNVPRAIKLKIGKADSIVTPLVLKLEPRIKDYKRLRAQMAPMADILRLGSEIENLTQQVEASQPQLTRAVAEGDSAIREGAQ